MCMEKGIHSERPCRCSTDPQEHLNILGTAILVGGYLRAVDKKNISFENLFLKHTALSVNKKGVLMQILFYWKMLKFWSSSPIMTLVWFSQNRKHGRQKWNKHIIMPNPVSSTYQVYIRKRFLMHTLFYGIFLNTESFLQDS